MIKSKDQILYETFPEKGNYITEAGQKKMRDCMDAYAKQEAITFAEWLTSKDSPYSPLYGETQRWCDSEREYTTAQLYEQFKKHTA